MPEVFKNSTLLDKKGVLAFLVHPLSVFQRVPWSDNGPGWGGHVFEDRVGGERYVTGDRGGGRSRPSGSEGGIVAGGIGRGDVLDVVEVDVVVPGGS